MIFFSVLDSSAKFPEGILSGSLYLLGNYDECISIRLYGEDQSFPRIQGKYCLADVTPNEYISPAKSPVRMEIF